MMLQSVTSARSSLKTSLVTTLGDAFRVCAIFLHLTVVVLISLVSRIHPGWAAIDILVLAFLWMVIPLLCIRDNGNPARTHDLLGLGGSWRDRDVAGSPHYSLSAIDGGLKRLPVAKCAG